MRHNHRPGPSRLLTLGRRSLSLKALLLGAAVAGLGFLVPDGMTVPWTMSTAFADEAEPPPPPPDEEIAGDEAPPSPDEADVPPDDGGEPPPGGEEVAPLGPGEAVVTRFSHVIEEPDSEGQPVNVIDIGGISASIIDIRNPGEPPSGQHWIDEPQRLFVTAGEVGQVFGVALAATGKPDDSPDIFFSATAAFGLHRTGQAPGPTEWMPGMWGADAGPGSIYRISAENAYVPEKFADITLDGRDNTGASLGNIAYDAAHDRLFVSDLETGMIHSLDAKTGDDLGHYDHGVTGRAAFVDVWTGSPLALDPVSFDPATAANTSTCPGDFSTTPECWNIADFRRRVWGLSVRSDDAGSVRLYYSVWGSDAFGSPDWPAAGDDRRNSVWSIAITGDGLFDETSVRREFFMPAFWPSAPAMGDKAGNSNAVSDIAFPACGPQNVMVVSERGGMRNLGLDQVEPFARPYESRVLRYELGADNIWRPKDRYEVGFHDRTIKDGPPAVFAGSAGGAAFGYGLGAEGALDLSAPSQSIWMTGDGLCSPDGACTSTVTGEHSDTSGVHGLQGSPADAAVEVDAPANPDALDHSYMIDTDINIDETGTAIVAEVSRNDATKIGDVAIYQVCEGAPPLPVIDVPDEEILPPIEPPEDWPVHTLNQSHEKLASSGHRRQRSWHRREGSWHDIDRSWHWKSQSFHLRNQTWHWRQGSWHSKTRSWHRKGLSLHSKRYSWHFRNRSWHLKSRTYHVKNRTWGGQHVKGRTYHVKGRTWGGHQKGRTYHVKGRTWTGQHTKGRTYHVKGRTWTGQHVKGRTYHVKSRTWTTVHVKGRTYHVKGRTWTTVHVKGRTFHVKGRTWTPTKPQHVKGRTFHVKGRTWAPVKPQHVKGRTFHVKGRTWTPVKPQHVKGKTFHVKGKTFGIVPKPQHVKGRTFHVKGRTFGGVVPKPQHTKGRTFHVKGRTFGGAVAPKPQHTKGKSFHVKGRTFAAPALPVHTKQKSRVQQNTKQQGNAAKKKLRHFKNKSFHEKATSKFLPR